VGRAVANTNLIDQLDDVNVIGSVKIRGVIGDAVNCELVRLQVCLLSNVELPVLILTVRRQERTVIIRLHLLIGLHCVHRWMLLMLINRLMRM